MSVSASWHRHKGKLWDTLDKPPKERYMYFKIDFWILTYACVGYFLKTLDQTNLSNAYASGMKEDYHFHGNQYNMASSTLFNIGYIVGQIPSQMVLTKVRPSIWVPTMELLWGICCMCLAATSKSQAGVKQVYALRFLIGLFESTSYCGLIGLLGQWYTPSQLGKRAGIFQISSSLSNMFSGYLQSGLHSGMNGVHGLASYQWLFIFDGIITIPVAIYGYFAIPEAPHDSKSWWLRKDEKELVIANLDAVKRQPRKKLTLNSMKALFFTWPVWLFSTAFIFHVVAIKLYSYMNLWLKSEQYSVSHINTYPTAGYAVQIVCTIIMTWTSDIMGKRWPMIVAFCTVSVIGCIILTIWPTHNHVAMFVGWYLLFAETGCGVLYMSWINETMGHSAEQRFVCIGVVEALAFTFQAWLPLIIYNTTNAPYFGSGYPTALAFFAGEAVMGCAIAYLLYKEAQGFSWLLERRDNDFRRITKTPLAKENSDSEIVQTYEHADDKSSSM
ncbi:hypothetical protein KL934_004684 [Ogataea polymorpha]|nr:hypothetical protein KL934_004684 [Ogataea polymorpha]